MVVDFAVSWLIGVLAGLRWRVQALLPIVLLVVGLTVVRAVLQQATVSFVIGATVVSLLGTQIGYLCGAAARQFCRK